MSLTKELLQKQLRLIGANKNTVAARAVKELMEYKDIEEKLGVDLLTLFKALERGIWTKDGRFIEEENVTIGWLAEDNEYEAVANDCTYYHTSHLCLCGEFMAEDYGRTWALTKEELL